MRARKLSEHMEAFKIDRPSEWLMGEWIGHAKELEATLAAIAKLPDAWRDDDTLIVAPMHICADQLEALIKGESK